MKVAFHTLGCKVNLFETQALTQLAETRGHEVVTQDADAVILNTCTVTAVSDHKNMRALHKLRKENPRAVIAACGCLAQLSPERLRDTGGADLICGTTDRAQVLTLCEQAVQGKTVDDTAPARPADRDTAFELLPAGVPKGRTRALLKIEDGCDYFCSYCIIPYARGRVRSMPPAVVLREAERLMAAGVHEIVLTGIEIASYGRDLTPALSLTDLLCTLLGAFPRMRFRLGSLDPRIADEQFCARLCRFDNLARHFHLSLQSGCDTVLQRMGRKYTAEQYYTNAMLLKAAFADCSVTTDLIVGFPGETEEEFAQTLRFIERCALSAVHVFPYSAREGTRAARMEAQLSDQKKAARAARAKAVAAALTQSYLRRFVGRTLAVLPEHRTGGLWAGHGDYGFPIYIEGESIRKNQPLSVRVTGLHRDGVKAEIIL